MPAGPGQLSGFGNGELPTQPRRRGGAPPNRPALRPGPALGGVRRPGPVRITVSRERGQAGRAVAAVLCQLTGQIGRDEGLPGRQAVRLPVLGRGHGVHPDVQTQVPGPPPALVATDGVPVIVQFGKAAVPIRVAHGQWI
ncbi:hypothetical protein RM423_12405 [Jatrophihabitans sp. DSM 44399]|uniref:Uncharacterized protein n=1 Tax=Jatrophihabitans lederbergiae TaxID=3075547 RepID=A0ABU2JBZ8_9ACTN|nr:hypothetical protein [Jatrophihabitans sp. DSM 44399]MDT0262194.1 hypothetical protein [Jatrophihabitans sp. DSM 44399]